MQINHASFGRRLVQWCRLSVLLFAGLAALPAAAAITLNSTTVNGAASTSVAPGATLSIGLNVTTSGNGTADDWQSVGWAIASAPPGSFACDNSPNYTSDRTNQAFSISATAPTTPGTYNLYAYAYNSDDCTSGISNLVTLANAVVVLPPGVVSITRASFNPSYPRKSVSWTVTFSTSVTGVDAGDFSFTGGTSASITGVTGSGTTWTVTAYTGTTAGTLRLNLIDNDSITSGGTPLGGTGAGNGSYTTGETYTLLPEVCKADPSIIFCDDFERSSPGEVGNGWTYTEAVASDCAGQGGNARCAGIDSDVVPWITDYANPRANPTRSMFTRWAVVSVDSPTINLAGRSGAQLSFWMRRGGDAFSEYPEASGENYLVRYLDNTGTWQTLAQYPSGVMEGQVFTPTIQLPANALHANFKMRFYQPGGSGYCAGWFGCYGGAPDVLGYDYWHMDDVIVRETTGPTFVGPFCENFEAGLGRWSISAEGAPASANIGDASIGSGYYQSATHQLDMRWGYVAASTFSTDLRGVTGNITYWVRSGTTTNRDPDSGENLVVEYLNSSNAWTTLATYLGTAAAGASFNGSHAIPADAKHENFRLRFRTLGGSGYDLDYWHVDDACVGDLIPVADLALTKTRGGSLVPGTNADYLLNVTNNGPGALSGSMQIVDTLPAGVSYLAGSGTGWVCGANGQDVTCDWSGTLANGAAAPTLTITVAVAATATGTLQNTATVSGTVTDNVPGNNTATDTAVIYIPSYVFTDRPCTTGVAIGSGATPCNLVTWSPQTAGTPQGNVYITALNSSGVPTQLSSSSATTVGFQFALSCHNPSTNAGVQSTFSATASALPLCASNGAVPTTWSTSVNLSFAAASPSVGPYSFNYGDVGLVELYMRNAAATSQMGTSGSFVVKPYSFVLTDIKQTAAPALANPAAADATGSRFVRAGEAFSVTVTAVNASCAASLGSYTLLTAIPASCKTPNYGREGTPEGVTLGSALVPSLGLVANPVLANPSAFGAFSGGSATGTTFSWSEVGIISLSPSVADGDYLAAGSVAGTSSANVGRFYPNHFETEVTPGCGTAFTYSAQPFTVKVTAYALGGTAGSGVTTNYAGASWGRNVGLAAMSGSPLAAVPAATGTLSNGSYAATDFLLGVATRNTVAFAFANARTPPLMLTIRATESSGSDAVTSTGATEGVTEIRSGRLWLGNAYGSEFLTLSVPMQTQFWTASGWQKNIADNCTQLTVPTSGNGGLVFGATSANNQLSAGDTTASMSGTPAGRVLNGDPLLRLSAPGAGHYGYVDIAADKLGAPAWLPQSGNGRACFGTCGPRHRPVIFQRGGY